MSHSTVTRAVTIAAIAVVLGGGLSACSSAASDGKVEITYLVGNDAIAVEGANRITDAFMKANPDVTIKLDTRPAGTEGDNLVKTKLATGDMSDVFFYNAGSLLTALNPDETLLDLSDEEWVGSVTDDFLRTVKTDNGIYGAPMGTSFGGGVLYNVAVYEQLGLDVPTSWAEFMDNSERIKTELPDVAPIIQAFGDTWTSQILVLADFANIDTADPEWAENYTANKAKYADEPALAGFEHQQDVFDRGLLNEDFPSLTNEQAVAALVAGEGAQYPMLTNVVDIMSQNSPDAFDDIGYFALPADDAANTAATVWQPQAVYIPKSIAADKLEAAKAFVAFLGFSDEACQISKETGVPAGPYVTTTCEVDDDAPRMVKDLGVYVESGNTAPALEFLSPIKGPNLENITVEVGSGISTAKDAAAAYDQDVKKQAQQLGLEGW
jgi:raffinose/stachyose/melibiose transport system substrate-binding protein